LSNPINSMPGEGGVASEKCIIGGESLIECPMSNHNGATKDDPLFLPYRALLGGRYSVGCRIGKGRRTVTYLARDSGNPSRLLAVKEYFPRDLAERSALHVSARSGCHEEFSSGLANFAVEHEMLKRVSHKNIIRAHGLIKENGTAYLVMDYCGGLTLQQFAAEKFGKSKEHFSEEMALKLMLPILEALEDLHSVGIIHCDVNANNIHLVRQGDGEDLQPVLLDFGSAQPYPDRGGRRPVTVTRGYSPPEQYQPQSAALGPEADLYACGATLYYLVTGKLPPEASQRCRRDRMEPLVKKAPALSTGFVQAVEQALSLDPEERPRRVFDFRSTLCDSVSGGHDPAPPTIEVPMPPIRMIDRIVHYLNGLIAPLLIAAALAVGGYFAISSVNEDSRPPNATSSQYAVPPADYYILRDVSESPDYNLYNTIEASILNTLRVNDSIAGDRSAYAIFAEHVTIGGAALQPASEGDIVEILKRRSFQWLAGQVGFRKTTRFDNVFASLKEAARYGEAGRKSVGFIISDGVPDSTGNETGCLGSSVPGSFSQFQGKLAELLEERRVEVVLILAGGNLECGGYISEKWTEIKRALPPSLGAHFYIVNLTRYAGPDQASAAVRELDRFLGTMRRAPCATIRPVYDRLLDAQRSAFDSRMEFSVDYLVQGHLGMGIPMSISRAEVLDSDGHAVGELDVVRRPQGDPIRDEATFALSSGADRDGVERREPLYFEFKKGFVPIPGKTYIIRVEVEQVQSCRKCKAEIRAEPGSVVRNGEVQRRRMKRFSILILILALAFSLCAWYYRKSHDELRRYHWLFRRFFIKAFRWWILFFFLMSLGLLVLAINTLDHMLAIWFLGAVTLVVCFMQYRKISSQSFRSAEPGPNEVLIVALESIVVPFLSLVLSMPFF